MLIPQSSLTVQWPLFLLHPDLLVLVSHSFRIFTMFFNIWGRWSFSSRLRGWCRFADCSSNISRGGSTFRTSVLKNFQRWLNSRRRLRRPRIRASSEFGSWWGGSRGGLIRLDGRIGFFTRENGEVRSEAMGDEITGGCEFGTLGIKGGGFEAGSVWRYGYINLVSICMRIPQWMQLLRVIHVWTSQPFHMPYSIRSWMPCHVPR